MLRDNQAFLSRFTNWAKFSAVASLGVIHKSHSAAAQKVLEPYLPTDGGQNNEYECGGGLYALGMMFLQLLFVLLADSCQKQS